MTKPAILFVCLGNICRSPLAEAAFRKAAEAAGLDVEVDSAGTAAYHIGSPPDPRSIATAREHGIDIFALSGRQLEADDFTRFTYIFAMDHENLRNIRRAAPSDHSAEINLLLDLIPGHEGREVDDPYYGGDDGFARTWDEVSAAAEALVKRLSG